MTYREIGQHYSDGKADKPSCSRGSLLRTLLKMKMIGGLDQFDSYRCLKIRRLKKIPVSGVYPMCFLGVSPQCLFWL